MRNKRQKYLTVHFFCTPFKKLKYLFHKKMICWQQSHKSMWKIDKLPDNLFKMSIIFRILWHTQFNVEKWYKSHIITQVTNMCVEQDTTTWKLHVNKDNQTVATGKISLPPPFSTLYQPLQLNHQMLLQQQQLMVCPMIKTLLRYIIPKQRRMRNILCKIL